MKLNINRLCYLLLCCLGISLGAVASAVSLLTRNVMLEVTLLFCTYLMGIMLVKARHKYPIFLPKKIATK